MKKCLMFTQMFTQMYVLSTMATEDWLLLRQAIIVYCVDQVSIALDQV